MSSILRVFLLTSLLISTCAFAQDIAVDNGTFDTAISKWDQAVWDQGLTSFSWDSSGHNASGSAKIEHSWDYTPGEAYGLAKRTSSLRTPITPGQTITVRAWVKGDPSVSVYIYMMYYRSDNSTSAGSAESLRTTCSGSWTQVTCTLKASDTAAFLRYDIRGTGVGTFYIDDVTVSADELLDSSNYDFEDSDGLQYTNSWPANWACVAWPPNSTAKTRRTTSTAFTGVASLEMTVNGIDSRCVALSYNAGTPALTAGVSGISIAVKTTGPAIKVLINYYAAAKRYSIQSFTIPATSSWQQFYLPCAPNSSSINGYQIEILVENSSAGTAWVDSINPYSTAGTRLSYSWLSMLSPSMPSRPASFRAVSGTANTDWQPLPTPAQISLQQALDQYKNLHPRLIFRAADIPTLRSWAIGSNKAYWDWYVAGLNQGWNLGGREGPAITWLAFGYVINEDPALLAAAKYYIFKACNLYYMDKDFTYNWAIAGMSFGYDWLFSTFTPRERDEIRLKLACFTKPWVDLAISYGPNPHWQFNHFNPGPPAYGLAGMALYGDGNPYGGDQGSLDWANYGRFGVGRIVETFPTDGTYQESLHYMCLAADSWLKYIEALRRFNGEDLFKSRDWFAKVPGFELHLNTADFTYKAGFSDCPIFNQWENPSVLLRLGQRESAQYANISAYLAGITNNVFEMADARAFEKRVWEFLLCDPRVAPLSPKAAKMPTSHHFEDLGVAVTRADWTPDSPLFIFKCGPVMGHSGAQLKDAGGGGHCGHNHNDAASFQVFHRNIPVIVDTGYNEMRRTNGHNTIMVDSFGQVGEGEASLRTLVPYSQAARITKYFGSDALFYAKGSAAGQYVSYANLTRFDRQVIGIEGKWFVIVDDLESYLPHSFNWIFNTRNAGTVSGKTITVTDTGAARNIYYEYDYYGQLGDTNPDGPSKFKLQFLKPDALTITASLADVEMPIYTWDQVWRVNAATASTTSSRFVAVLALEDPNYSLPTITMGAANDIIIDNGRERAIVTLTSAGCQLVKYVSGNLVAVGAIGHSSVTAGTDTFSSDSAALDWCKVFCGYHNTDYSPGDLNRDCYTNLADYPLANTMPAVFKVVQDWLSCTDPLSPACQQ